MKKWSEGNIGDLVLYKNNQLIAFNKPAGVPVQADQSGDKSLFELAEIYVKHPLHLIHRIDRPVSGVVLFAKNKRAMTELTQQFENRQIRKTYLAVVPEKPDPASGEAKHYLRRSGHSNRMIAMEDPTEESDEAILHYILRGSIDNYHLLEIDLITGRHHQIRAQLSSMGMPIKGDVKYGFRRRNRDRSIDLHAWKLQFHHPVNHEEETIIAPLPEGPVWQAFPEITV